MGVFAQVQSPEQFLGYKIGERFTPHWRIVEYFKHVAASTPGMVKLQQYGQTYEGRPLVVAFISSAANIANLENIRSNNLALANNSGNSATITTNAPAIVWLSYNVHGNEASSSETSMMALHALVDPANAQTKSWLHNTVVVLDPCLNPDGRDRYVNWYNSVVGAAPNPNLDAREHNEPWPGGRSNHYNFDLNRDWAWQTQIETRQRVALYNQWLPQIHVDFHEQYINSPYYFAPAAEPFHEVITPWQRSFQEVIGRNNARYFDQQGWLYFTRELFDLLYPSYGDTYPTYNGAIGMTYEQAGHSRAGLAARTESGDTLTLYDRALHHFTTTMSTLEVASQNAAKLVSEFHKFFNGAVTKGVGEYKSYIIKYNDTDAERISGLVELLRKNDIRYGKGKSATMRGYNYDNGKEESFSVTGNDIVVPAQQPKSALVKVLFEPKSHLSDTATYDITAWSLPYVYGVKSYATSQRIEISAADTAKSISGNSTADPYAYVIRWNGMPAVKLVSQLLQKGIKIRFNEQPFEAGKEQFGRGSIIILKTSNQYYPNLWATVRSLANSYHVQLTPVSSGFVDKGYDFGSSRVQLLNKRRVAVLTGEGVNSGAVGEIWHFFDQQINYPVTLINASDFSRIHLNDYDVLVLPDGNYRFLSDKASTEQFRNWISGGGNVVALQGAVAQLAKQEWSIKPKKEEETDSKDIYEPLRRYEARERDELMNITPGSIFKVELDNTHPLAFGYPGHYYTLKQDDNIYDFIKEGGWNVGVIKKNQQVAGFVGSRLQKRLQDGLLFGVQNIGNGNITYLADDVLFRSFWENGKLMFSNAVFLVGQ